MKLVLISVLGHVILWCKKLPNAARNAMKCGQPMVQKFALECGPRILWMRLTSRVCMSHAWVCINHNNQQNTSFQRNMSLLCISNISTYKFIDCDLIKEFKNCNSSVQCIGVKQWFSYLYSPFTRKLWTAKPDWSSLCWKGKKHNNTKRVIILYKLKIHAQISVTSRLKIKSSETTKDWYVNEA